MLFLSTFGFNGSMGNQKQGFVYVKVLRFNSGEYEEWSNMWLW